MPGRIVGALNQGIASLGEKIGNNTNTTSYLYSYCINQITSQFHISIVILTRD